MNFRFISAQTSGENFIEQKLQAESFEVILWLQPIFRQKATQLLSRLKFQKFPKYSRFHRSSENPQSCLEVNTGNSIGYKQKIATQKIAYACF